MKDIIKLICMFTYIGLSLGLSLNAADHTVTDDFENGANGWQTPNYGNGKNYYPSWVQTGYPANSVFNYPSWKSNKVLLLTGDDRTDYVEKVYHFGVRNANKPVTATFEVFYQGNWYWNGNYFSISDKTLGYSFVNVPRDAFQTSRRFGLDVAQYRKNELTDAHGDFKLRLSKNTLDRSSILWLDNVKIVVANYISPPPPPPPPPPPSGDTGAFDAWDIGRGDTTGNGILDDIHISTKIASRSFNLKLARVNADGTKIATYNGYENFSFGLYNGTQLLRHTYPGTITGATSVEKSFSTDMAFKDLRVGFTFCADYNYNSNSKKYEYTIKVKQACSGKVPVSCRTTGKNKGLRTCYSTDHFAVRPQQFSLTAGPGDDLELLRAGKKNNLVLRAGKPNPYSQGSVYTTNQYTTRKQNIDLSYTLRLYDGSADTHGQMHGLAALGTNSFSIKNGTSIAPLTGISNTVDVMFPDVGNMKVSMIDDNWASIDSGDTPQSCSTTSFINSSGRTINNLEPAYICGEADLTFIPDHFKIKYAHVYNNNANNDNVALSSKDNPPLTYLTHNGDLKMSAKIHLEIRARAKQGQATLNFKNGDQSSGASNMFENPIKVTLGIPSMDSDGNAITHTIVKHEISTPIFLGFNDGKGNNNGSIHVIERRETDPRQQLSFNYNKNITSPSNPISPDYTQLKINVSSLYRASKTGNTALITGTATPDKSVIFYDSRVVTSSDSYTVINGNSKRTPLFVQVYCNKGKVLCKSTYGLTKPTKDANWYISENHFRKRATLENISDGSITLSAGKIHSVTTPNTKNGQDKSVKVKVASVPSKVKLYLDKRTDSWLKSANPTLCTIEFKNPPTPVPTSSAVSKWSGHGTRGLTLDLNSSSKISTRVGW